MDLPHSAALCSWRCRCTRRGVLDLRTQCRLLPERPQTLLGPPPDVGHELTAMGLKLRLLPDVGAPEPSSVGAGEHRIPVGGVGLELTQGAHSSSPRESTTMNDVFHVEEDELKIRVDHDVGMFEIGVIQTGRVQAADEIAQVLSEIPGFFLTL